MSDEDDSLKLKQAAFRNYRRFRFRMKVGNSSWTPEFTAMSQASYLRRAEAMEAEFPEFKRIYDEMERIRNGR